MHPKTCLAVLPLIVVIASVFMAGCAPSPTPRPTYVETARETLTTFFSLLHDQDYREAVKYYGGAYDALRYWDPPAAEDHAALFRSACTFRLKCLRIKAILREEEVSPTEFEFDVQFMDEEGTLFRHGPCCGAEETEIPPQTQFRYTVKRVGGRFLVQEMPVVLP